MDKALEYLLKPGEDDESMAKKIRHNTMETPERTLLAMLSTIADYPEQSYIGREYVTLRNGTSHFEPHFKDNPLLDEFYYLLTDLGYQISDEEKQMRNGTHPLFVQKDSWPGGGVLND